MSNDTITSQIRKEKNRESELLGEFVVTFVTDGTDGELKLTFDDSVSDDVEKSKGWMDMKRLTGGEPMNVWDDPIEVLFKEPVTV